MSELPLSGRNAVVTGGAVRLGRAIALRLASEGANVCIHYGRSAGEAREVVAEMSALGVQAASVQADFGTDPTEAAARVFAEASTAIGPIDLLTNNAAIFEPSHLDDTTAANWDRHLRINLQAPVWLTREFTRQLPVEHRGSIVNVVDWRGLRPVPGHLAYTVSKAGLVAATRLLAQELGPQISVNAVAPGAILPPPGGDLQAFEQLAELNPLQKTGGPEDIADAVLYLATTRFVTGEVICVTGGQQL